ncbi:conserved virulence factor C family protein [Fervidibacillus halotolerans]|uniref:Conserved virulence factor C family protein n=1 Tax=Fervidibacillus halotolerans TaxID=2980027 RepID=A0A9E8M0J2_9BACI|nr:conserved virulence factor C family protein [Fervidibacillus halotolerans]WAA13273.1 conserved virulence factor C family protein [Fervidibacillus halotolerans]
MKIKSIEPTPSPHTMKVILDEELPKGARNNYKKGDEKEAPEQIRRILQIEGVKGVYHVADFLAVERHPKADWKQILPEVRSILGDEDVTKEGKESISTDGYGEVEVYVQYFKGIPMQVKLVDGEEERRYGLPEMFLDAARQAQLEGDNIVLQRKWVDYGVRYGELDDIGQEIVEEIGALFPESRLKQLVQYAKEGKPVEGMKRYRKITIQDLEHSDWRKRYEALERMAEPTLSDLPLLEKALMDEKPSIRRLAVVYLGMIEDRKVLPYLYKALKDPTVTVRRTAGDCLSDLGFPEAQGAMAEALKDKSKIVRWRAAMFLYESGDKKSLPALKEAENDPEFEVALQVKMAIERIEGGKEAKGSVWKQMTEERQSTS